MLSSQKRTIGLRPQTFLLTDMFLLDVSWLLSLTTTNAAWSACNCILLHGNRLQFHHSLLKWKDKMHSLVASRKKKIKYLLFTEMFLYVSVLKNFNPWFLKCENWQYLSYRNSSYMQVINRWLCAGGLDGIRMCVGAIWFSSIVILVAPYLHLRHFIWPSLPHLSVSFTFTFTRSLCLSLCKVFALLFGW